MVTKKDVIASMRRFRRLTEPAPEICADKINAISYVDIMELYLALSGCKSWTWVEERGKSLPRQSLGRILTNLARDVVLWPSLYWSVARAVARLYPYRNRQTLTFKPDRSALFLRTDHWFNVKSGGSVGHLSGVINGLRQIGYRTYVVSSDPLVGVDPETDFHLCEPVYGTGRNLPNIPELLFTRQVAEFASARWKTWSPAFIYQRYSLGNFSAVLLREKFQVPYVCEYNGSFPWTTRHWDGKKLFHERLITRIELLNLQAADLVVVVSQPMKDELIERGIEDAKILVNPNGVDPDRYSPTIDGSQVRRKYSLADKTVIGFIGTFGKWHGAEVLAEAFARLITQYPQYRNSVRLLMIGDGPTMPQVKDILAQAGVTDLCTLTGLISQAEGPAHLAACDILASPHVPNPDGTPFFGSPTKLFEYMAMGKGIVASNLDQIGQILTHEKTAWMVEPGSPESLMLGLKTLIDNPPQRNALGQAASQEVLNCYTWRMHTQKTIDRLRELCR